MSDKRSFSVEHWQKINVLMLIYDFLTIAFSFFFGLWLRFDFRFTSIPQPFLSVYYKIIIPYALLSIAIYWMMRLYKSIWRFASYDELSRIVMATTVCGIINFVVTRIFGARMPSSYHVIGYLMQLLFATVIRFSYRFILLLKKRRNTNGYKKVMLIGANMSCAL